MSLKKQKLLIENVKDIMGTKDIYLWLINNNPTVDTKILWEGLSNAVWYAYYTEPACIRESELKILLERAEKFDIKIPNLVMKTILQLNEQLAANDDISLILKLQKELDNE
jgi:hypothetical protein